MPEDRPPLFDFPSKQRAAERAVRLAGDRFLDTAALEGLTDRLSAVTRRFERGLWIGEAVPELVQPFAQTWQCANFDAREVLKVAPSDETPSNKRGPFDLAVSLFSLQWINDLPGALIQIRRLLKPDGLFLTALMGAETLTELRDAFTQAEIQTRGGVSPRVSPFADVRDLGSLLQRAGFALPVADVERLVVRYRDFTGLVKDLRAHAFTNVMAARSRQPLRRDTLTALLAYYAGHHADPDGKLRARFETMYLTGWSPHESQQQPLKPGSAKTRLAAALGTTEHNLKGR